MATLFVATGTGCRVFTQSGEAQSELVGRSLVALACDRGGNCIAIVDENEIWRRSPNGAWSLVATAPCSLQSIAAGEGAMYAGGMNEPVLLRISADGRVERLHAFDNTPGKEEWLANGPPLGVRALAITPNAILAAVHVGGIPRSVDGGQSWKPTIPVLDDAHDVCAHPSRPDFFAAATAVGLCVSQDSGASWANYREGSEDMSSLAVTVLEREILFSLQQGPFAKQSQLWRWRGASAHLEQVRSGLPLWFEGKIDTHLLVASHHQLALVDGGGNLWWSQTGSFAWQQIATISEYVSGLLILS